MMNVAIIGLGVVGKGVYNLITNYHNQFNISYVMEINKENLEGVSSKVTPNYSDILNDDSVDTIVELIGGEDFAYYVIKEALLHKKNVVTANKAVIS